jgi:cell wall-associated NlpC family hydrolase
VPEVWRGSPGPSATKKHWRSRTRKPLIALGLIACASLGATPAAKALAAPPLSKNFNSNSSSTHFSSNLTQGKGRAVSGAAIVQTAMKYLGYPYTATGNSPNTGFSCIGFVSFVYRSNGIPFPGDLGSALAYAPRVPFSDLKPGDILYFQNTVWKGLSHAAIYIGGGKFIHAEYYNRGVVITSFRNDPVDGSNWIGHYLAANRPASR